jgi:hypothetical protein
MWANVISITDGRAVLLLSLTGIWRGVLFRCVGEADLTRLFSGTDFASRR